MNEQALELVKERNPGTMMKWATDVAGVSREIVMKTAVNIQGRKYVKVEGWQAIAVAHGCVASSKDVEKVAGGYRAIGEVRRMADGVLLAQAEGFIGEDEPTWFGGITANNKTLPKRAEYAIRAMCQTRAISRACRSAFAHVVILIDGNLSTTPAEEVPEGGFVDVHSEKISTAAPSQSTRPPSNDNPARENGNTVVECVLESFKRVESKPGAAKPWTAWFCKFSHNGQEFEAGTFSKTVGESLDTLQGNIVNLEYHAGKKEGTYEIVAIEPTQIPF